MNTQSTTQSGYTPPPTPLSPNHPNKKPFHFPQMHSPPHGQQSSEKIEVYLRSSSKKAIKIEVLKSVSVDDIKAAASKRLGVDRENQILKLNGKDITQYSHVLLDSHCIIHVGSRTTLIHPSDIVTLKIKIINSFQGTMPSLKIYTVNGDQTVENFMVQLQAQLYNTFQTNGAIPYYSLLESSRLLDKRKSFYEQEIPRNAELICLITKNQLKTRFNNDTSEDIISDISALLELDTSPSKHLQSSHSPVPSNPHMQPGTERPNRYQEETEAKDYQRSRRQLLREEQQQRDDNSTIAEFDHSQRFKKKTNEKSSPQKTSFLKALKARRPKKVLDEMLKQQGNKIFYREDVTTLKDENQTNISLILQVQPKTQVAMHKPSPTIPKVMPVEQRRKIKLEMQKLFDLDSSTPLPVASPSIEEQQPKSPPTKDPPRLQKRRGKMSELRHTMGARPTFLNHLITIRNDEN